MQSYKTLGGQATARLVEKKSEFIAVAAPVQAESAAINFLNEVRAAQRGASHHVYAYSLRRDARQRYSDDGEPAKTAGLPVLGSITHAGLTDCIVVVTRYFGGTLLGTGGLVRAYSGAAQAALQAAKVVVVRQCVTLRVTIPYSLFEQAKRMIELAGAKLEEPTFAENVTLCATLPAGAELPLLPQLDELCRGNANVTVGPCFYTPF